MKIAYLDGSSGISGDMFLGALIDAGVDEGLLRAELMKLPLANCEFKVGRVMRCGLAANFVEISVSGDQPHRHLHSIEEIIGKSEISGTARQKSLVAFRRIAEAEGKLHGKPPEKIHFHEVGAVDAILDMVGTCAGFEMLGVGELIVSPLNLGSGRVEAAHGSLPVPAPATAEILKGVPVYSSEVPGELVTPTGAALVKTLATGFGPMPTMKIERIGYGAGSKDFAKHPNIARLFLGERVESERGEAAANDRETVSIIEANVDDMSPQVYGYFAERALAAGALDVTCQAIQMKKNRPGLLIRVMGRAEQADSLADLMISETTTIGVRIYEARRITLDREWMNVSTEYGTVRVKIARLKGEIANAAPEFADCERIARERNLPVKDVIAAAVAAYRNEIKSQVSGFR